MEQQALSPNELRIIIAVVGAIVLAAIYLFAQPRRPGQGRRTTGRSDAADRVEPTMGEAGDENGGSDDEDDIDRLGEAFHGRSEPTTPDLFKNAPRSPIGVRPEQPVERIVTLYVSARGGSQIEGSDLVVAAEKCGLEFGDMGIFHRMVDGKPELGPIFSAANMVKPGNFDMSRIDQLNTPGLSFFMALPGPLSALDAWDTMLPTAQRLAELLDAVVLDEERNALGRQRVAHIRDELRAWDRRQDTNRIKPGW